MQSSSYYRSVARERLENHWTEFILCDAVITLLAFFGVGMNAMFESTYSKPLSFTDMFWGGCIPILISLLVVLPLSYGFLCALLAQLRKGHSSSYIDDAPTGPAVQSADQVFGHPNTSFPSASTQAEPSVWQTMLSAAKSDFGRIIGAYFLMNIAIALVSIVTFGVGGIILSYSYSQVYYLLRDYPNLSPLEALRISRQMMQNHKLDRFLLDLSFIGWYIVAIFTLGLAFFYVSPYLKAAQAAFYLDLKDETLED